jgi:hypothetical protein
MKKIDFKKTTPIFKPKNPKVTDPVRYPKLIDPMENKMKKSYSDQLNLMMTDLTIEMANIIKNNK